jgi:FkbM family methyltransferase
MPALDSDRLKARVVERLLWVYAHTWESGLPERPFVRRTLDSAYLAYKRLLEAGPVSPLRSVVAPGSTVIDVGANIGFFSLRFGRWVGPGGRVIAIEPEVRNMATLRRRVRRAGLERITDFVQAAAADRPGELRLELKYHPGAHRIADAGEPIRAVTLDELTAEETRRIALIKIDVQGAEMMVLAGARRVIETRKPAIFIEIDDTTLQRFGSSAREVIGLLADLGYRGHTLRWRGIGAAEAPETLIANTEASYGDLLFLPQPPH